MSRRIFVRPITFSIALALGLWVGGLPTLALAGFKLPSGRGLPGRREPAGTRQPCLNPGKITEVRNGRSVDVLKHLTALTPVSGYGETTRAYPTFLWHMPRFTEGVGEPKVEFSLEESETKKVLYQTTFDAKDMSGIMGLTLPSTVGLSPLQIGKTYIWSVRVLCSSGLEDGFPVVEGMVQRIQPGTTLTAALKRARPRDLPSIYIEQGVWYDAIAALAELRRAEPGNALLTKTWTTFLQDDQVKLQKIAGEPLTSAAEP